MRKAKARTSGKTRHVKTFEADQGVGMTEAQAKKFLVESRSVLKLGTIDASGDPNVHPVWYYFEPKGVVLYAFVAKNSKKAQNIERRRLVYFDVDDDKWPYKGVRGKGEAKELTRMADALAITEKILGRYIKKDHPMFAQFLGSVRKGTYVVVKITPMYLSTWDYGRMPSHLLTAGLK